MQFANNSAEILHVHPFPWPHQHWGVLQAASKILHLGPGIVIRLLMSLKQLKPTWFFKAKSRGQCMTMISLFVVHILLKPRKQKVSQNFNNCATPPVWALVWALAFLVPSPRQDLSERALHQNEHISHWSNIFQPEGWDESIIICLCSKVEFTWPDIWDPNMAFLHVQSMNELCKWKVPNVNQIIRDASAWSIPGSESEVYCSMSHWPIGRNGSVTGSITSHKKNGVFAYCVTAGGSWYSSGDAVSSSLEIGWSETLWARIGGVRKQNCLVWKNSKGSSPESKIVQPRHWGTGSNVTDIIMHLLFASLFSKAVNLQNVCHWIIQLASLALCEYWHLTRPKTESMLKAPLCELVPWF